VTNDDATAQLYAFHCGGLVADMASYDPFDPRVGTEIYSPNFFYFIRHPRGNVLFDVGIRSDFLEDAEAVNSMTVEFRPEHHTDAMLATVGVQPEDVEHVVMSHLHWDHAGALQLFPHATVYVNERELEFAYSPAIYQAVYYDRRDFDHDLRWQQVKGEHDLFGDGSVVMFPTPGHTPGHQILLVRTKAGTILLLGDAAFEIEKMRKRVLFTIVWNPDEIIASWDRIEELEREHEAELICAHELEFRTKIRLAPQGWYE
jgi:glyoxylase-like metal-dependent hydrolase (beta-lactamase superfamily II)